MKRTVLVFLASVALSLQAQEIGKLTLKDAIAYAEKNSPAYQNAQMDVNISKNTVQQIQSAGLPQINASGTFQQYLQIPGSYIKNFTPTGPEFIFLRFQQKYASSGTIQWNQLIFDGTFFLGLKAAKEFVNLSQMTAVKSKNDLHIAVAKAYLLALTTAKNIELLQSNITTLEKSYNDISVMNKEGFAEILDVQRLELALSNLKIQKEKLENAVVITVSLLKFQMGMPVDSSIVLADDLETVDRSISDAEITNNNFEVKNRLEYKLFEKSIVLSYMDEKRYKLGYFPTLNGFLSHQATTNRSQFNFFESNLPINNSYVPATLYGLNLQIPIFDGLRKYTQIQDVKMRRYKTQNDMRSFENYARLEYNSSKLNYEVNMKQAAEQKKNLDLAKEIYNKTNIKFKEGVGSSLEIVQSQNDLKTAQTNYLNALYDLVISKMDLKKAKGEEIIK